MLKLFTSSLFVLITLVSFSQEVNKDTLKTEEIIVVKPYTPTISEAFKVKSNPDLEGAGASDKETINYSIFSIPVASTFTPSKGKAQGVKRGPKERLYENYISAGFGNYTSPLLEAYIHSGDRRYNDYGLFINHHSSQGGIKDLLLDDSFSDTRVDAYYKQYDRDFNWKINGGVQIQKYNYYGLPSEVSFENSFFDTLDEKQLYKSIYIGGQIEMEDSYFKGASGEIISFSDDYGSNELRLLIQPKFEFPISTELINAELKIDLTTGKFDEGYVSPEEIKYSFLNLGFNPNFEILRDDFTLNLGAKLYYSNDLEQKINNFYAYPNVTASLKVVDEIFILIAGVTGDLEQNTYRGFAEENPFISPTLTIEQTDNQYRAYGGAKGKLASNVSYNFNVSHASEMNKALFIQNQIQTDGIATISNAYQAGNSFGVVYDDVKTLGLYGEITIEASKEFNFGGSFKYASYNTNTQLEAWNLPNIKVTLSANYSNNSWFAGSKLFLNGKTKDYIIPYNMSTAEGVIIENNSYIDLNFNGGYIFSDRLTAFAKINNALSQKYDRFVNYEVQSLQVLAGITYKFDF
jgi:hypothetical protein